LPSGKKKVSIEPTKPLVSCISITHKAKSLQQILVQFENALDRKKIGENACQILQEYTLIYKHWVWNVNLSCDH